MTEARRLPWRRNGERAFIAFPNGERTRFQYASVRWWPRSITEPAMAPEWTWRIEWQGRFSESGRVFSKQQAADQATSAWWAAIEAADKRELEERQFQELVSGLVETGQYDLSRIDLQSVSPLALELLMRDLTTKWKSESYRPQREPILEVIRALSAELFRRRIEASEGTSQEQISE